MAPLRLNRSTPQLGMIERRRGTERRRSCRSCGDRGAILTTLPNNQGGTTYWARIRWTDPVTHYREGMKRAHPTLEAAEAWGERMQRTAKTGVDSGQTLGAYVTHIGDRWTRGIDPTSTSVPDGCANRQRATPTDGWAAAKGASRRAPGPSLAGRRA